MYLSDQELAARNKPIRAVCPRLSPCQSHKWGVWMRDVVVIKVPGGIILEACPATHYRRFCQICKAEQKGRGNAYGLKVEPV